MQRDHRRHVAPRMSFTAMSRDKAHRCHAFVSTAARDPAWVAGAGLMVAC